MVRKQTKNAPKKPAAKVVDIAQARVSGANRKSTSTEQDKFLAGLREAARKLDNAPVGVGLLILIQPDPEGDAIDWHLLTGPVSVGELYATIGLLEHTKTALLEVVARRRKK